MPLEPTISHPPAENATTSTGVKLLYVPINNFGDALNPWIWKKLLPLINDELGTLVPGEMQRVSICSIGSYLSHHFADRISSNQMVIVAGTGAGYGQAKYQYTLGPSFPMRFRPAMETRGRLPSRIHVSWVRGPLTAKLFELPSHAAVADAAYLLRQVLSPKTLSQNKTAPVAYMPHIGSSKLVDWRGACDKLGWTFVDPQSDREQVLQAIGSARTLVTEALHGAITADALRTPWIATRSSGNILDFKWRDHCASINVQYDPVNIRVQWLEGAIADTQRHPVKRAAFKARAFLHNLMPAQDMTEQLLAASTRSPQLSDDSTIKRIDDQLTERITGIRKHLSDICL